MVVLSCLRADFVALLTNKANAAGEKNSISLDADWNVVTDPSRIVIQGGGRTKKWLDKDEAHATISLVEGISIGVGIAEYGGHLSRSVALNYGKVYSYDISGSCSSSRHYVIDL